MRLRGHDLSFSATDLSNFLGCRHRTALDMAAAHGAIERRYVEDPLLELLWQRGTEHEKRYVASLQSSGGTLRDLTDADDSAAATRDAMRAGVDTIVQGVLENGPWTGRPDVMCRVDRASALGRWSYEIHDTKLARETRAGTILQLGLYSAMLAEEQALAPEYFHVVTPDGESSVHTYRVDDYAAYVRFVKAEMLTGAALGHEALASANYPEPVEHCEICAWQRRCADTRRADDHLSLVANITGAQRRELESRSVTTLTGLAALPEPLGFKPKRGSAASYDRVRNQARVQLESRGRTPPLHELLAVQAERGLCRLPAPTAGDLFLDLEGDPFGGGEGEGREYLFGLVAADGSYRAKWAFTDGEERAAFEWVMDEIAAGAAVHPDMHVYHYAAYESVAFKRLMGRYATRERELDAMLRGGRLVDLYAVVKQGLRAGVERYSIKNLEPLYGFTRDVALSDANRGLRAIELALGLKRHEDLPAAVRDVVEGYNRDDCVSTLRLRDWLERVRAEHVASGVDVPRPVAEDGDAPAAVHERERLVEALREQLLAGVPEARADRDDGAQSRWLLAYLLDYHRREGKVTWWDFYRVCGLEEDDLLDERGAVAGVKHVERVGVVKHKKTGKPTGSVIDRYRFPFQEIEIDAGDEVWTQDRKKFGDVVAIDRASLTVDIKKSRDRVDTHPTAIFAFKHIRVDVVESSITRIAEAATAGADIGVARALLAAAPPRCGSGAFGAAEGEEMSSFALRIVSDLRGTVLPIQGPPGSGKTYVGARMICELVRQGKRVGITAGSHKVIRNLLDAVADAAADTKTDARLGHKCDDEDEPGGPGPVTFFAGNPEALEALESGAANVVGGTAWLWSRPEFARTVDVLFIDEAGQLALANALAVSPAADTLVLLGDPQQLEQPRKGSHPDGVGTSALEHMLGDHKTIPADRGLFLPVTWRLAPSICAFTSELFYEGRLTSRDELESQRITGVPALPERGLAFVGVDHDGNKNFSAEEIDAVAALVERLTASGAAWTNAHGELAPMTGENILVVAPYNSQVTRLTQRLEGTGARVGTVDKFQGQEAPVVIYSMATSRPEDAPRGMEFLYSLNRLNVATSRARCLAVLVASPRLFEPECRTPRQMRLANALCRFRELATHAVI